MADFSIPPGDLPGKASPGDALWLKKVDVRLRNAIAHLDDGTILELVLRIESQSGELVTQRLAALGGTVLQQFSRPYLLGVAIPVDHVIALLALPSIESASANMTGRLASERAGTAR